MSSTANIPKSRFAERNTFQDRRSELSESIKLMSSTALHRRLRYFDIGEELVLPVVLQPSFKLSSEALDLLFESATSIILQWIQAKVHLIWEPDSHIATETFRSPEYLYTMWMVPTSHSHMVLTKIAAEPSFYTSRTACPKTLMVIAERKSSFATQAVGISKQNEDST